MDIDSDRSYVFMSSELQEEIQLEGEAEVDQPKVLLKLGEKWQIFPFIFLENDSENSTLICVNPVGHLRRLVRSLVEDESIDISIDGSKFKSRVVKLESNRSYLRITR